MTTDQTLAQLLASNPIPSTANPASVVLYATLNGVDGAITLATILAMLGGAAASLAITGTPPATATVGAVYNFTPNATGGTGPYTYALTGSLPAGLTFSTASGEINGTLTTVGSSTGLNITATDSEGATASVGAFSITVSAAANGSGGIGLTSNLSTDGLGNH